MSSRQKAVNIIVVFVPTSTVKSSLQGPERYINQYFAMHLEIHRSAAALSSCPSKPIRPASS